MSLSTGISQAFIDKLVAPAAEFSGPKAAAVQVWTGRPLVSFPTATSDDAAAAVGRARQAQLRWFATPRGQRLRVLRRYAVMVRQHRDQIIRLLQVFRGLSHRDAFDEYLDAVNTAFQNAVFHGRVLRSENHIGSLPVVSRLRTERLPIGVVGLFTLADYQASYGTVDVEPIIAARNGVVQFVPAQAYPVTMAMRDLAVAAGLPRDLWQVIPAFNIEVGRSVLDHLDHLSYIGNTATGLALQAECTDLGIGTSLFMSSKNHGIVLEDADMDKAVSLTAWQAFMASGHSSIHTEIVHVHVSRYREFLDGIRRFTRKRLVVGATYANTATFGSSYSAARLQRTVLHTRDALESGGRVLVGGHARPDIGPWFHEPTVVTGVTDSALAYDEETYGPLLQVRPYEDLDEVTGQIASSSYCHSMQLFTRDGRRAHRVIRATKACLVAVNDGYHMTWGAWNAPAQGWGETGTGIRHGHEAILQYTRPCVSNFQYVFNGEPFNNTSVDTWEKAISRMVSFSTTVHSL